MKSFLKRLQLKIKESPNSVILCSQSCPNGITYKQLDDFSNKVCQYLKDSNIGKEDFVLLVLPREVCAFISIIGVWKAGAGLSILEDDYPIERINYIKTDLNCKLVITQNIFDEMMNYHPCNSYFLPKPHDACYASYTSGSTGQPKGVLHEFGKLNTFDYDYNKMLLPLGENERFAILTPLNFGPTIRNFVASLLYNICVYVVPKSIVKNSKSLIKYFNDNEITFTSATSSFFRAYSFSCKYLKNVFIHSEPCTDIFSQDINIINLYTLSEVAFPIFSFRVDKPYSTAPIGYRNKNIKIKIINEKGKETTPLEVGEIVVKDIYTRGYINPTEKTAKNFQKGYFYCGDLAYYNQDNMAFLVGRKDDMIKINGNRVEPMEIEIAVKNAIQVKNAIAKGFIEEKRSFIAIYLLKDELEKLNLLTENGDLIYSTNEINDKLKNFLPYYMMPYYYIVLNSFPKNENNKLLRKDLPKPIKNDYITTYKEPQNETEEYFCHLFESVLGIEKVGVNDNFFEIGGDSLSSIMAISNCDKYDLTIYDIYNGKTPRAISNLILEKTKIDDIELKNQQALLSPQHLSSEQQIVFEVQMEFKTVVMDNLVRFVKLTKKIDISRFINSVKKVLKHHPVFSSVIIKDNGYEKLLYKKGLLQEIPLIEVSKDKLNKIINSPLKPFEIENSLLYRTTIYKCESSYYFYFEIHHLITDGTSIKLFFEEINSCYYDEKAILPTDYYFYLLQEKWEKLPQDCSTEEFNNIFQLKNFAKNDLNIRIDNPLTIHIPSKYEMTLNIPKDEIVSSSLFKKYNGNIFFLTCFLKTIAEYNKSNKALAFWVHNGRNQKIEQNAHGLLIKTIPMSIDFSQISNFENAFMVVKDCINKYLGMTIPFMKGTTSDFLYTPCFVYQKDIMETENTIPIFEKTVNTQIGSPAFEFHIIDNTNEKNIKCLIKHSLNIYYINSVKNFCYIFENIVNKAIK